LISWDSPRWGRLFAGTVHDWEKDFKAPGVIRGLYDDIHEFMSEHIWEEPISLVSIKSLERGK
jgi:hypothetical protein